MMITQTFNLQQILMDEVEWMNSFQEIQSTLVV